VSNQSDFLSGPSVPVLTIDLIREKNHSLVLLNEQMDVWFSESQQHTVPVKCKLTVPRVSILASRDLILDPRKFRESSLESSFENFEDRVSSQETNELDAWVISREINRTNGPKSIASVIVYRSNKCVKKWGAGIAVLCDQIMTNDTVIHLEFAAPFLIG